MPSRYVLDASAGVDILQRTADGQELAATLRSEQGEEVELWTVEHFYVEVTKVLRRDVLSGVLDDDQASRLVVVLTDWPLEVVAVVPLLVEAWQMRHNVIVHDALYVVLTRHLDDATLVSADRKLPDAPGVDVPVITPDRL